MRIAGGIAGLLVVLLIGGYMILKRRPPKADVQAAYFRPVSQWTSDPGVTISPSFSSDGKLVAYASDREGAGNLAIWVRSYPSGAPQRVTRDEFNARDPDISPDNSQIVYRSERDGGGIFIAPISETGEPRLLAKGGMRPRFSSDGKWIAYYAIPEGEDGAGKAASLFIVSPAGGSPRRIRPDFADARYPVWRPDHATILYEGTDATGVPDWWVTPIEEGAVTRTHAFEALKGEVRAHAAPERWIQDKILFSGTNQSNFHVWEIGIQPRTLQAWQAPKALTDGDGIEQLSAIGPDGRMLFARMQLSTDVWSLPLDGHPPTGTEALQRVTNDRAMIQAPTAGFSGAKLVYVSNRTGLRDLWIHDLKTGSEFAATSYQTIGYRPVLSADEKRVAYRVSLKGTCGIMVHDIARNFGKQVGSGCFNIWDWSPDGSTLVIYNPEERVVSAQILKTDSGQRQPFLSHPAKSVYDAGFSRDGKWMAFTAGRSMTDAQIYVAPFRGTLIRQTDWIPVTTGGGSLSTWSADSNTLYFHSRRDGFHCIWAQKLNGAKKPIGDPYAVQHLHATAFGMQIISPNDFRMSATNGRLLLNLAKQSANLWIMDRQ